MSCFRLQAVVKSKYWTVADPVNFRIKSFIQSYQT